MGNKRKPAETDAIALLKQSGYEVRKPVDYVKTGLELDTALFRRFTAVRKALGLKAKVAINLAIAEWISRHEPS